MGGIVQTVKDTLGIGTTSEDRAAQASQQASQTQAGYQNRALDYLKQAQAPVLEAQQGALGRLGSLAQGGVNPLQLASEQELLEGIDQNPLYQSILGTLGAGEEAVLRNQAATGGFRSGDSQANLAELGQRTRLNALTAA